MGLRDFIVRLAASRTYRTQGELAREQMRRRGLPYYDDRLDEVERRLRRLKPAARAAFAAGCAERLHDAHDGLPLADRPFTLPWRATVDDVWAALGGDEVAHARVRDALDAFARSEFNHEGGQDGPGFADDDAAAASIQAAEALVNRDADAAFDAATRTVDHAFEVASAGLVIDQGEFDWLPDADPPMPLVREAMHPVVQSALDRLEADLDLLEGSTIDVSTLERLRLGTR